MGHDSTYAADLLDHELAQRRETGYDVTEIERQRAALGADASAGELLELLDALEELPPPADWPYDEPSERAAIEAWYPTEPESGPTPGDELRDRLAGAWLGRIAGNMLGKPIEDGDHWTRDRIRSYLELCNAYPLTDYLPVADPMPPGYELRGNWIETTRGRINGSSRDDDVDYTILGLHLLETHGRDLRTEDVGAEWLLRFPYHQVYTAERVAYRNLVAGLPIERVATYRNPYREWIGALIRADIYGYVFPGRPREAALLAYHDAALSHVANGIYGEMWAAAMVAIAFTASSAWEVVERSLAYVPPRSRLAEEIRTTLDLHAAGHSWESALAELDRLTGRYGWVHTLGNAGVIAAGLLWGDGDYTATIAYTVRGGLDTDSNGGTAGSVAGVLTGAAKLPAQWTDPLHDRVRSALFGFDGASISDLSRRTYALAEAFHG